MIPQIVKNNLRDLTLNNIEKTELLGIINGGAKKNGFVYKTKDNKCVAIGKERNNDFDFFRFAEVLQKGSAHIDRIRFILVRH